MIVKNEERFLAACLRSVAGVVDEMCIVDTGSTDRTVKIATSFGARIEHRVWRDDFAWARNEALALATKRWIFVLDADEELDSGGADVLRSVRTAAADRTGLWVRCNNLSDDYKGTGVSTHALVRLFPNNERIRYSSPVHEFITVDGRSTGIDARMSPLSITHHGYLSEIVQLRGKAKRNLLLVQRATETDPDEPFNWYNLGTTSLLCGEPAAAIVALEKMRELAGATQRGFIPNALAQLADLYTDRGDLERGVAAASDSLAKAPHFANAHFALGRALVKLGRYDEGRAAFRAAIDDAEHSARQFIVDDEVSAWKAHSEIGTSYGTQGDDVAALEWFERGLSQRPLVVPLRLNRARALERLRRLDEAEAMFADLARDEPGDVHSVDYINYLLRHERFSQAAGAIETALAVTSPRTQASLLATAAKIVARTGGGNVGVLLERALATHGGAAEVLEAAEQYYRERGDQLALERIWTDELSAPMMLAADYARRATQFLSRDAFAEAEAATLAGLELFPNDPALRYNLGVAFVKTNRKREALSELQRVPTAGDIGLRAAFLTSIVLSDLKCYSEALDAVDAVLRLAPAEIDAHLHRFRCADALGHDTQAESTLRAALEFGDMRVATELATWLLRKNRFAEAAAVAQTALATV